MDTRRKKGNEKRKELEGELYQFSFSKTDRMTAYRYIFQFDDLVGPSIAKYLMRTFGLGPGCESFHAAYIDHVGEWYRVRAPFFLFSLSVLSHTTGHDLCGSYLVGGGVGLRCG
eukprot:c11171_g1_i2.p1 GENE.c11171_g1_i2~~c11171_g1_i2.p1  ORF type:complete len:114 (+),score=11.25 c11171_g1_i2:36-377(+)